MTKLQKKLAEEVTALCLAMLYFAAWIGALMLVKTLVLAEYQIAFHGWSMVLIGVLVLAKVALILEHVSLGAWIRAQPAWVDVILRTALYSLGVATVLVLEKGFEGRHEYGGFSAAVIDTFQRTDIHHIWATTICLSGALFGYNVISVVRRRLGKHGLGRIFLQPMPDASGREN